MDVHVGRPPPVFVLIAHLCQDGAGSKGLALLPSIEACEAQVAVEHPKRVDFATKWTPDMLWECQRVFRDEGRTV